ncbi:MAG: HU family DNA-binding protein [Acidimicrobiales bacterium]|nr:HU family DNA-binding protein [Acidimicrobiales bacterium]
MNKSELVDAIASKADQSKADVGRMLDAFEDTVTDSVAKGEKISLPGFLTFERGHRAARTGKNPQTGAPLQIPAANVAKVKVGSKFKQKVAGS